MASPLVLFVINKFKKNMGGLPKDSRCPLEQDLADECGVSRTTVRKAYELLEQQGVVYRQDSIRLLRKKIKPDADQKKSPPISKEKEVSEYLIGLIGRGELVHGQRLSENKIAAILGCSISPVREALISLAPLGIFEKETRQQWQVVNPDNQMFEELYEFRSVIEIYCLKKLMRPDNLAKNLPGLKSLLKKTKAFLNNKKIDYRSFYEIDAALHHFLLKSSNNSFFVERIKFVYVMLDFHRSSGFYDDDRIHLTLSEHLDILKAIIAADKEAAISALDIHISGSLEFSKRISESDIK